EHSCEPTLPRARLRQWHPNPSPRPLYLKQRLHPGRRQVASSPGGGCCSLCLVATKRRTVDGDGETERLPRESSTSRGRGGAVVHIPAGTPPELPLRGVCRIGAGAANDVIVLDRSVSRSHVELAFGSDGVTVRDLGSKNGTFYLGQRIGSLTVALGARI